MESNKNFVLGVFDDEDVLLHAVESVRGKGVKIHEVYSPFPVHGLDDAMGLPRSGIPWISFFMGLMGLTFGFGFQYLTHAHDWGINFSGKALNAWPAYVPVTFETTVFFAGMSAAASLFVLGRLGSGFRKPLHPEITSHRFAIWIPSASANYKQEEVVEFLTSLGAKEVTVLK